MFAGLFGKIAWGLLWGRVKSNAVHDWQALSPRAKLIIVGVIAAIILFFVHQHYAHKALNEQYKSGYAQAQLDDAKTAKKLKDKIDALTLKIAQDERKRLNEENARIDHSAAALLVRGPGKASCTLPAQSPAAAGGPQPPGRAVGAQVAGVPDAGGTALVALPFADAVGAFKDKDKDSAELESWHRWYNALAKAWPSLVTGASGSSYTEPGGKIADH